MSAATLPWWVEALVALLLVASGLLALAASVGLVRLRTFFARMHAPALVSTLAAWCAATASVVQATAQDGALAPHAWLVPVLLSVTVPVTTVLLARAVLFRKRQAGADVPPPLSR